ncbi:MAG: polyprenol monophosphomannose synthase [Chloroflexi bacterium]|nr:polyprenol monophosphomannose synthase [Chloroflexota bacterium]
MSTTIIIPIYNEAKNLPRLVPALLSLALPDLNILFIDDNSPDGSGELAEKIAAENPGRIQVEHRQGKMGLGSAYVLGYGLTLETDAQYVCQMDADFSHPPDKVPELAAKLEEGCDLALGSRYVPGGAVAENWPMWRKSLSRFGNFYASAILSLPLSDSTGGFRMWRREALAKMPFERVVSNGYAFQVEVAYMAHKLGLRIGEVPFYFADRKWGQSKMSLSIQIEAAWRVWQVLFRNRGLRPGGD